MIIDCNMNLPLLYWATEQTGIRALLTPQKRTSCRRQTISSATMPPRSTPIIWTYKPARRATAIPSRAMPMTPAGRAGRRGDLRLPAELYLYRRRDDDCPVEAAGELLPQPPPGRLRLPLGSGAGGDRRAARFVLGGDCGVRAAGAGEAPARDGSRPGAVSGVGQRHYVVTDEALPDGQRGEGHRAAEALGLSPASNKGVDECASWGDYFYVEALVRFTQSWKLYW